MPNDSLIVFDIGARYGVHPTWLKLFNKKFQLKESNTNGGGEIVSYYAFDVDSDEIERLKLKYKSNYFAYCVGFSDKKQELEFNYLAHRGQSSFLLPNLGSNWFVSRPGESKIASTMNVNLITLDDFCNENNIFPEFLKLDTEGFDLKILKGAKGRVLDGVLAINCEVYFEESFLEAPLFSKIFEFLLENGFILANLDYAGKGIPSSYFCPDVNRFGILTGCEAIFIKNRNNYIQFDVISRVKLILFLFNNKLEDLAFKLLKDMKVIERDQVRNSILWSEVKLCVLNGTKRLQYLPGVSYQAARRDFEDIFNEDFPEMHNFFENIEI